MLTLTECLTSIMTGYQQATKQPFARNPLAAFIRKEAAEAVEAGLADSSRGMLVVGSAGAGNWASVPWISIFDTAVTETATKGYYVVYLFHHSQPIVHLSLNQGTTAVREEFRREARAIMRDRAILMQRRIADISTGFSNASIELGSSLELPGDYEAGHAFGVTYELNRLPAEHVLRSDLQELVRIYRSLTFRGGLDQTPEDSPNDMSGGDAIIERRRYRLHERIERNASASKLAKKHHGSRCQACNFDFEGSYGEIGKGFIEAHHLQPISSLEEGVAVAYLMSDFAVLCSNCHRMIHRWPDPADLDGFRNSLLRYRQTSSG